MVIQQRYLSFTIILVFLLSILYSCSGSNLKSSIIGKWVNKSGRESFEFLKDGTVIVVRKGIIGLVEQKPGNYKFIDNNRLKVDLGYWVGVFEISIDKEGQLSLKDHKGDVAIFIPEAMAKKREDFVTYWESASAYLKNGQYDKAIEDYSRAIAIDPNNANAYNGRGIAYRKKDQYDKALEDFNKAIAIDPNSANAYNGRGIAYRKKDQYDKALEDFNKAIAIKPTYYAPYFDRACIYSLQNNESAACDSLNKAFENADDKNKIGMRKKLKDDSDFDKIRNSNCYKKIMGTTEKKKRRY